MEKNKASSNDFTDYYGSVINQTDKIRREAFMSDYLKITKDYINKMKEEDVCKEYFRQKELVSTQYPDLKKQIDEFRCRNYKLQNETDADRLFDETDRFEREYEEFRKNPIVSDFLAAELAFCRMYQEIQSVLGEAFAKDFDLSD